MRATSVFVRFLSLLDVALVLLGVLMIALTQAQLRSDAGKGPSQTGGLAELAGVEFIYLYVGWEGSQKGRCYLLNANQEVGREIRTDTSDDIDEVLRTKPGQEERSNKVALMLFDERGWYAEWDQKKLAGIEQTWKMNVVPAYNVNLSRGGKP